VAESRPMTISHDLVSQRLTEVVKNLGVTQTQLAQTLQIDRTSLSQLMSPTSTRLPRVETLVTLAQFAGVSVDWLLGLTNADEGRTDIVDEAFAFEREAIGTVDERLVGWLQEASGAKVRYVPTSLPDLLKTSAVIRHETDAYDGVGPDARIDNATSRLAWQRTPEGDVECVSSLQALEGFARGEDLWRSLPRSKRIQQLEQMITLVDELYPTFRWFLIDRRKRYCAPVTIFGTRRAALYIGQMYMVVNTAEHVTALIRHFDQHVRHAAVEPRDVLKLLQKLLKEATG
jgi:transcriptional regulator with XRE-family HTH domain